MLRVNKILEMFPPHWITKSVSLSHERVIATFSEIAQQPDNPQVKLSIRQRKSVLRIMCTKRDCIMLNVDTGTDANGLNA